MRTTYLAMVTRRRCPWDTTTPNCEKKMRTSGAAGAPDRTNELACSNNLVRCHEDRREVAVDFLFRTTDRNLDVIAISDRDSECVDHRAGNLHEPVVCCAYWCP